MGKEGKQHVEILYKLACDTTSLLTDNRIISLWDQVHSDDITLTVSPYVADSMKECYAGIWAKDSVGDIVDMIVQAPEAIAFVHVLGIVHRDLYKDNYIVQWHPESLSTMRVPLSRPRVYLTDLAMASEFPPDVPPSQCLLTGAPIESYRRPVAPEVPSGIPYDPFKTDMWQLAESLSDLRETVLDIDVILEQMFDPEPFLRPCAADACDRLATVAHSMPAIALLIPPRTLPSPDDV